MLSQSPVNLKTLIPILGFFGSPHNLIAKLLEIASHLGSFSQVSSIDENPSNSQSLQVSQVWQVVQTSHGVEVIQFEGPGVGDGVGVGVGNITVPQVCV